MSLDFIYGSWRPAAVGDYVGFPRKEGRQDSQRNADPGIRSAC